MPDKQIIVKNNNSIIAYLTKEDLVYDGWIEERQNKECRLTLSFSSLSSKIFTIKDCNNELYIDGKVFSLLNSDAISIERTEDNKLITSVTAIERWQAELETDYHQVYNSTTGFDHIDEHMVIIVSGGSDLSGGRYSVGSAGHALYALLQGTGWTLKDCNVDGTYDLETDKKSTLANIYTLQEQWGGIIIWDSVNRIVSLMKEELYEPFNGFQIKYGNNMKHIAKSIDNNVISRLYVYGERGLNIASINSGNEYIDNFSHTNKIRKQILTNPNITTQEYLKTWGERQSEILGKPKETYVTSIVDLSALDEYTDVPFNVNDMCNIIDVDIVGDVPIQKRIVYKKYNVFEPCLCSLEIGDNQITFAQELKDTSDKTTDIDNGINDKGELDGYLDADEIDKINNVFTRRIADTEGNVSVLQQTAYSLTSRISSAEGNISYLEQTASSISMRVTNAEGSIASLDISVSDLGSQISLKADRIELQGYVTFSALSTSGSTTINGGNIRTGTINASVVSVINLNASNITAGVISADRINVSTLVAKGLVAKHGEFSGTITWGAWAGVKCDGASQTTIYSSDLTLKGSGGIYLEAQWTYIYGVVVIPTELQYKGSVIQRNTINYTNSTGGISSMKVLTWQ